MKKRRPILFKTAVGRYDAAKEALEVLRQTYKVDYLRFLKMRGDPNQIAEEKGRLVGLSEAIWGMEMALSKRIR